MELIKLGTILSPYKAKQDAPRQGKYSKEIMKIVIDAAHTAALHNIDDYKHLVVLYWGDRSDRDTYLATPPGKDIEMGVFACRSPNRPNPIALCVVELVERNDNVLTVVGLDALDGSPLLDIKPYLPLLDTDQQAL